MNIIEAFIKFNNQLIIIISGIDGCGKNKLAKKLSNNFNLKLIKQYNYLKNDFKNIVTLDENSNINNFYSDDAFDWEKLNNDVNKYKHEGIILTGISFPNDIIKFKVDYHLHLSISKQECIEKKQKYLEKHKETHKNEYALIGTPLEKRYMNKFIYPYYIESIKKMHINNFYKGTSLSDDVIYDNVWDVLINFIQKNVDDFANSEKYVEWKKKQQTTV